MDEKFMKEKPVLPLILSMSLPMVLSMLVNSLYNIVDSFSIEHFSVIFPRPASFPCLWGRKHCFHSFPLSFCQFISLHSSIFALTIVLCNIYFSNKP